MALYTVTLNDVTGPDVVSLTDGSTYATLEVSAGRGPKGDGFTGGSYSSSTGQITFTSNDGIGFSTGDIRPEITAAVAAAEAAQAGAETAEAGAEAAQAATESIFDQFGDQYLGPKASDPTVDNDGDPLTEGDIYFNTTDSVLKFYSGTAWVAPESIATTAASDAQAAQAASEAAQAAAETAETNAETAETNSAASASSASSSASAASTSASEAAASAASINLSSIDIDGGTIDGTVIGGSTPAAGSFTTGSFTGNVAHGDNVKATFGNSADLQVYHDGSNTRIVEGGQGSLIIQSNQLVFKSADDSEILGYSDENGAFRLYYDGTEKLATTSSGIDVTGTVVADGLTVDAGSGTRVTSTGNNIQFDRDDGSSFIDQVGSGGIRLRTTASYTNRMDIANNGDISFYEDTGTTAKFFWDASAESLGIGTGSPTGALDVQDNTGSLSATRDITSEFHRNDGTYNPRLQFNHSTDGSQIKHTYSTTASNLSFTIGTRDKLLNISQDGDISFYEDTGTTAKFFWDASAEALGIGTSFPADRLHVEGNIYLGASSRTIYTGASADLTFQTNTGNLLFLRGNGASESMRIDSSGRVGIGTTSPSEELTIRASVPKIQIEDSDGTNQYGQFYHSAGITAIQARNGNTDGIIVFQKYDGTTSDETVRIDSSGNLKMTGGGSVGWANWTITESGGSLYFATGGTNKMKLDASGNLDVVGSVNANATIT